MVWIRGREPVPEKDGFESTLGTKLLKEAVSPAAGWMEGRGLRDPMSGDGSGLGG